MCWPENHRTSIHLYVHWVLLAAKGAPQDLPRTVRWFVTRSVGYWGWTRGLPVRRTTRYPFCLTVTERTWQL
jgi:hypothetical protein